MSETMSQDPDGLTGYTTLTTAYPTTPATPSSTVQDVPSGAHLPPFSTFSADMETGGFSNSSDRLFSDTRLLDISNWDYYTGETRLLERGENGLSIIASQPQYRPWESKPVDSSAPIANGFHTEAFGPQSGTAPKLPSFQSQFQPYTEPAATTVETTLTTLTNLTPVSPNHSSPSGNHLTSLNSNFHTLSAVNPRGYPLVPAPIQAREIPSIQQQILDERHIQLYSHPTTNLTTLNTASIFPPQNGTIIQNNQLISSPTVLTVFKSEPELKLTTLHQDPGIKLHNVTLHPTQFQNPVQNIDNGLYNMDPKKMNGMMTSSPTRNSDFRKKERRKMRASSLESSTESDGASSNMDLGSENSGQVAAISSTAGYKNHHMASGGNSLDVDDISGGSSEKQVKKKRKRCGECIGCQRKDNCGDCAPCRNDKSHQICKQRRCEKLTEKKNLYGDGFLREGSRRGRGKGRGGGSYRGRKAAGSVAPLSGGAGAPVLQPDSNGGLIQNSQPPSRPSPQPAATVHMIKAEQTIPVQQQPMTPMPFYADPNRFATPVWQTEPAPAWAQGQFIQQIPVTNHSTIETYQQYPNGIYQTTYQQPGFETNTFYTGAVQVLSANPTRPPSNPPTQPTPQPIPRPNSNYVQHHASSPVPQQQQPQQTQGVPQRYDYGNMAPNQTYPHNATTPNGEQNISRPNSVNSVVNGGTTNQNFQNQQQNTVYTSIKNETFSPNANTTYVNANNSGNEKPGYPQIVSNPQLTSHNSSGYSGSQLYSGEPKQDHMWSDSASMWTQTPTPNSDSNQHEKPQEIYQQQHEKEHQLAQNEFVQSDRVNLNTKIKTMILNKQNGNNDVNEKKNENNSTGHFLWFSHQGCLKALSSAGGSLYRILEQALKFVAVQIAV